MNVKAKARLELRVAATVSGEDLAHGDYIALLNEAVDFPSFLWDFSGTSFSPHEVVRFKLMTDDAGQPLKVIAICLPFVYVRRPDGETVTIDIRRFQLVRLDRQCAKAVWKKLRSKSTQKKH